MIHLTWKVLQDIPIIFAGFTFDTTITTGNLVTIAAFILSGVVVWVRTTERFLGRLTIIEAWRVAHTEAMEVQDRMVREHGEMMAELARIVARQDAIVEIHNQRLTRIERRQDSDSDRSLNASSGH